MTNQKFTINGTSNAQACGIFDSLYSIIGENSKAQFSSLAVAADGKLMLLDFIPNITEGEIYNFLNRPLRLFRNELPNGIITTSIRGITSTDFVHLPHTSPIPLENISLSEQVVSAFLVDTATDEIKGIRMVGLSPKTISQLIDDWTTVEKGEFSTSEINHSLNKYVYPYSPDEFQKRSNYFGRDVSSITTRNLYTF